MSISPDKPAGEAKEGEAKPHTFSAWTGKRHVYRVRVPEFYWIAAHVHLLGDVPAANHEVRLLDPDTGEVVADKLTTDDEGVLRAEVPSNKEYRIELVHEDEHVMPGEELAMDPEAAVLLCQFVDGEGQPLANHAVEATFDENTVELVTDENGRIEAPAQLGHYALRVGDEAFDAHSLLTSDRERDENVYHFVVAAPAGEEASAEEPAEDGEEKPVPLPKHDASLDPEEWLE